MKRLSVLIGSMWLLGCGEGGGVAVTVGRHDGNVWSIPSGIDCGDTCSARFPAETEVTFSGEFVAACSTCRFLVDGAEEFSHTASGGTRSLYHHQLGTADITLEWICAETTSPLCD